MPEIQDLSGVFAADCDPDDDMAVVDDPDGTPALKQAPVKHVRGLEWIGPLLVQSGTLTTGTGKLTFRMPNAFTLTEVRCSVGTAPTGGTLLTVDLNESGTTVLSTKLTFDASEKTTTTAETPAVISDSALADDAEMTVDIDDIGSTIAGADLYITLIGRKAA